MSDIPFNEQVQTAPAPAFITGPWTFQLNYPRPLPGLHANDRANRWTKAASTKLIREQVYYTVRSLRIPALERISVDLVWVVNKQRGRDAPNLWPMAKAVVDGIASNRGISARIVDDDTDQYVEQNIRIRYDPNARAHFEITITDLGSAT